MGHLPSAASGSTRPVATAWMDGSAMTLKPRRTLVTGSRDWTDAPTIFRHWDAEGRRAARPVHGDVQGGRSARSPGPRFPWVGDRAHPAAWLVHGRARSDPQQADGRVFGGSLPRIPARRARAPWMHATLQVTSDGASRSWATRCHRVRQPWGRAVNLITAVARPPARKHRLREWDCPGGIRRHAHPRQGAGSPDRSSAAALIAAGDAACQPSPARLRNHWQGHAPSTPRVAQLDRTPGPSKGTPPMLDCPTRKPAPDLTPAGSAPTPPHSPQCIAIRPSADAGRLRRRSSRSHPRRRSCGRHQAARDIKSLGCALARPSSDTPTAPSHRPSAGHSL